MKILVYSSVFYPAIGGIENHSLFLVREFVKAGHEVRVITEQEQDPLKPLDNVPVYKAEGFFSQLKHFYWSDVFYMPNITLKGAWLILFNPFKKWVISHNDFHLKHMNDWRNKLKFFIIRNFSINISVSRSVHDFLNAGGKVIYNCYDNEKFRSYPEEERKFDFVFVGRLVSQKGCEVLINACNNLNRDYSLNIIGDGFEKEKLQSLVIKFQLQDKIKFLGFMQGEQLARMLNRHKNMIVPSLDVEGFGIVALEGMACGCRMIVTNAGGLAEAVGDFGSIFPMGDTDALTAILNESLDNVHMTDSDTLKNEYLIEHSKHKVAAKYLEVFANN